MPPSSPNRVTSPFPKNPGLALVPKQTRHSLLALWHLLSLDAPTVAYVWTFFIARCCHITLAWTATAAMFLGVWTLYAADRLLDARILDAPSLPGNMPPPDIEERHRFHHRHKSRFVIGLLAASILLSALLPHLNPAALGLYAILGSLLVGYFFLIHLFPSRHAVRLPKEFAVGIFFSAAVFIPTIARQPNLRPSLFPIAALFAAICTLNCLYLYVWEHPTDRTSAHTTTRFATNHLITLTTALIAVTIAFAFAFLAVIPAGNLLLVAACTLSTTLLLLLLHTQRHHVSSVHLRAAADLTLLTPLLFLPFIK